MIIYLSSFTSYKIKLNRFFYSNLSSVFFPQKDFKYFKFIINIRYMCKLALGSRNDESSVLTFFQTFRLRLESSSVRIYFYKNTKEES